MNQSQVSASVLSRCEVERLIAEENALIVIMDQMVLRLDGWLKYHPGGSKPIQHMIGRDATDEITS